MDAEAVVAVQQTLLSLVPVAKAAGAIVMGALLSQPNQAIIEHNLANWKWMPTGVKAMLPTIISSVLGFIATKLGVDPVTATLGAGAMAAGTHAVNESDAAADSSASADAKAAEKAKV